MANQINTSNNSVLLNSSTAKAANKNSVNEQESQQPVNKGSNSLDDRVSVTSEASRLQKIEEQLSNVPAVNSAKVAEIKQAIADGSFTIDPQAIASKLIAFETGDKK